MRKHAGIWIACLTVTGALAVWTRADGYQISALSDDLLNITHTSSAQLAAATMWVAAPQVARQAPTRAAPLAPVRMTPLAPT